MFLLIIKETGGKFFLIFENINLLRLLDNDGARLLIDEEEHWMWWVRRRCLEISATSTALLS